MNANMNVLNLPATASRNAGVPHGIGGRYAGFTTAVPKPLMSFPPPLASTSAAMAAKWPPWRSIAEAVAKFSTPVDGLPNTGPPSSPT